MRSFALFLLLALALGGGYLAFSAQQDKAAQQAARQTERQAIAALRDAPALRPLIARGQETCTDPADHVIWACGAVIRLPDHARPRTALGPLCSSAEAPLYVGSFQLPEITSAEARTRGLRVRPNIPAVGPQGGLYVETLTLPVDLAQSPRIVACEPAQGHSCAALTIGGRRSFLPAWIPDAPRPPALLDRRPPPATIVSSPGRSPVFLDLDGLPVRHEVNRSWGPEDLSCRFHMFHPMDGYVFAVDARCDAIGDWRDLMRGILAELSARTLHHSPGAQCDVPPAHVRVRPKAHWASVDQHQALHDWAAARHSAN